MTEELVEALWVGSYPAELPDRRILRTGQDTATVGRHEAETSDNWLYPLPGSPEAAAAEKAAPAKPAAKPAAAAATAPEKAGD